MFQALAGFRGLPAFLLKTLLMAGLDAVLLWMLFQSIRKDATGLAVVVSLILIAVNVTYFWPKAVPAKFLIPGTILLLVFVATPVVNTIWMSFFNYQTGNEISKSDALDVILASSYAANPDDENSYFITLGTYQSQTAGLLYNETENTLSIATPTGLLPADVAGGTKDESGAVVTYDGFTPFTEDELLARDEEIQKLIFPTGDGTVFVAQPPYAVNMVRALTYDRSSGTLTNVETGAKYVDGGKGNFVNVDDSTDIIEPGWRAFSAFENYKSLFIDPAIRGPFVGVVVWTFAFAIISVLLMFAFGLVLALALDKPIRGRRLYRSILILPYAIPSLMSILVWNGLFNTQFGAINSLLGAEIDWYNNAWLARFVVILVNLWLGIPYFYLISSGALQSIPAHLEEAATVDGASPRQTFLQIKLPLVLQVLSPLLIASFAFNFNNFNIVYLLTAGGPTDVLAGERAGATDLLITYTYKTAVGSDFKNFGLACAISMLCFVIVGLATWWSMKRSKMVEASL